MGLHGLLQGWLDLYLLMFMIADISATPSDVELDTPYNGLQFLALF
jgi:hypothetical protein